MKQLFPATESAAVRAQLQRRCASPVQALAAGYRNAFWSPICAGNRRREGREGSEGRPPIVSGAEAPAARLKAPLRRAFATQPVQNAAPGSGVLRGHPRAAQDPARSRAASPLRAGVRAAAASPSPSLSLPPVVAGAARAAGLERG